ncbi:hypothetical protein M405DRAFT_847085 [Rhizopogon salebrosus TDB-379]|nr:hypothetical protein M405DRAFT_847085 [Rhizopogon salebrosus TDB-379]
MKPFFTFQSSNLSLLRGSRLDIRSHTRGNVGSSALVEQRETTSGQGKGLAIQCSRVQSCIATDVRLDALDGFTYSMHRFRTSPGRKLDWSGRKRTCGKYDHSMKFSWSLIRVCIVRSWPFVHHNHRVINCGLQAGLGTSPATMHSLGLGFPTGNIKDDQEVTYGFPITRYLNLLLSVSRYMHSLHYYSLDFRAIRHSTLDERRRHLGTSLAVKMLQVADGDQASGLTWSCFNCANDSIERYWLRGVIGSRMVLGVFIQYCYDSTISHGGPAALVASDVRTGSISVCILHGFACTKRPRATRNSCWMCGLLAVFFVMRLGS